MIKNSLIEKPITLKKAREILIEVSEIEKMARVSLDGKCIKEGNFWDFKGYEYLGRRYNSHIQLSTIIYQWLIREKKEDFRNIKTIRKYYNYNKQEPDNKALSFAEYLVDHGIVSFYSTQPLSFYYKMFDEDESRKNS